MIPRFVRLSLELFAGIAGNLIAAWIQQDLWSNMFTPVRIIGTIIGVIAMLIFLTVIGEVVQSKTNNLPSAPKAKEHMKTDTAVLREMLLASFDDTQLTALCFDYFRPVYDKFSQGLDHSQKVQLLLDHCQRHGQIKLLLDLIKEKNPHQYQAYIPRMTQ